MPGWLTSKIALLIGGVLSAALGLALLSAKIENRALDKQLKAAQDRAALAERARGVLEDNVAALQASVVSQNAQIDNLKARAAMAYANGRLERQRASEQAKTASSTAARLAKAQPKPGADLAAATDALILEEVQ